MFIHAVPALFSAAEAAEVIRLAADVQASSGGLVGGLHNHNIRRADIAWLDDTGSAAWVMERIVSGVARANRDVFDFDISDFRERLQVAAYDESVAGHYDWHSDIGDGPIARWRKLTIVVQLSDPESYRGGELEINPGGATVTAARGVGDATLFASFMLHRVAPVTHGTRHSLTCWCHGPAFR
ncbi:2OG-Fe(II) oxygenase [Stappia indica]|uniref:2OG-Fe(II) oxygenase n=1 Tax=Stappia indica TaxID=538381 RepID=UPI001CD6969A|nr:2OG-Fe(II) oxygenase [Stappia indica]MCA1297795.1 2OG-Fe(II) oxygenase [Stappia indica]